jgi:aryl-alcohol dehydrogenase-like predicted oxidoreductase
VGVAERRGLAGFVSQQIHYTLQAREAESELLPIAVDQGLGVLVWSPLAGGLLSGKYRRGEPPPVPGTWPAGTSPRSATRTSCTTSRPPPRRLTASSPDVATFCCSADFTPLG